MMVTDYLVIGAGAASMAFVDTLLTANDDVSVVMVDRHAQPGGHWQDAYGYVQLHQPSLLYGVSSVPLEGSWWKLSLLQGTLPWTHRARRDEILSYYRRLMDQWIASRRVQYFPNCSYDFSTENNIDSHETVHEFTNLQTQERHTVRVREKLVNGVLGECRVPSQTPPNFPVDDSVSLITPNDLYIPTKQTMPPPTQHSNSRHSSWLISLFSPWHWFDSRQTSSGDNEVSSSTSQKASPHYVILGAGKTAMDAVVYLQRQLHVPADRISWIVSHDGKDQRQYFCRFLSHSNLNLFDLYCV